MQEIEKIHADAEYDAIYGNTNGLRIYPMKKISLYEFVYAV
jgi:hypothetical protein